MSVVAYRDGILASDSRTSIGSNMMTDNAKKVIKVTVKDTQILAGIVGESGHCYQLQEWVRKTGADFDNVPSGNKAAALVVKRAGKTTKMFYLDEGLFFPVNEPYMAVGSGLEYAQGALHVGASAVDAVSASIKYVATCGGKPQYVKFDD